MTASLPGTTTRTVTTTDGLGLAVHDRPGPGPTVVLVHGFPDTAALWAEVLAALDPSLHVVAYDVRGAGASDGPARTGGYALPQLAADLRCVLDLVSPDAPAHVVGHDWGAIQTFEAATDPRHAGRLASFTCVSGASLDQAGALLRRVPRRAATQLRRSWYIGAFQLPWVPEAVFRSGLGQRFIDHVEPLDPRPGHPAPTARGDAARGVGLYRANLGRVLRPRRTQVLVPVQIVLGDADPFITPMLFQDLARHAGQDAFLRVVPGGHWLPRTHPQLVAAAIGDLLALVEQGVEGPELAASRLPQPSPADRSRAAQRS